MGNLLKFTELNYMIFFRTEDIYEYPISVINVERDDVYWPDQMWPIIILNHIIVLFCLPYGDITLFTFVGT